MTRTARMALEAALTFIEDDTCRHDSEKVDVVLMLRAALDERAETAAAVAAWNRRADETRGEACSRCRRREPVYGGVCTACLSDDEFVAMQSRKPAPAPPSPAAGACATCEGTKTVAHYGLNAAGDEEYLPDFVPCPDCGGTP